MALSPEILIPRIGDVLVEEGLITQEQLAAALETQKQQRIEGKSPLLGQILIEMNLLDKNTLDQAITKHILILQNGLRQANETLEKRVQERTTELEEAYKRLSVLNEMKANFVANISHELRTPLTHIMGYLDLLLSSGIDNLTPEQKESLQVIAKASDRLNRMIEDLILFSTAEVGEVDVHSEIFDVCSLVHEVVEKNKAHARKRNVRLKTSAPESTIKVLADRGKILWVVNQLVDNAIKFNLEGGTVDILLTPESTRVKVEVCDSGIGIDPAKINEIFEPFHQLDSSSTRKQGGTGLGLTLVQKILEAHKQKVVVESVPGKGSRFSFFVDKAL